mgnify:CR=1 FL=1
MKCMPGASTMTFICADQFSVSTVYCFGSEVSASVVANEAQETGKSGLPVVSRGS